VNLHAARAGGEAGRLDPQLVAWCDRARPQRPRDHRAGAGDRERAVDVEARGSLAPPLRHLRGDTGERGPQFVEALAGLGADGHDLGARNELTCLLQRELQRLGVHGVSLRHGNDAALDAEQPQDREVLVRLRPGAFVRVDHEQEEVDPGRSRDHRPHEPLVAGNVDQREPGSFAELEGRVPERDRDAALLFLGQPVGVLARERPHEPRLAVVDVPRRPDGQRHRRSHPAAVSTITATGAR
jgi:hypothetical protein